MNMPAPLDTIKDIDLAGWIGPQLVDALNTATRIEEKREPTWSGKVSEHGPYYYVLREESTGLELGISSQRGSECAKPGSVRVSLRGVMLNIKTSASKAPGIIARDILRRLYPEALVKHREIVAQKTATRQHEDGMHALISTLALAMGEQPPREGTYSVTAYYGDAEKPGGFRMVDARAESPDSVRLELRNLTKAQALAVIDAINRTAKA